MPAKEELTPFEQDKIKYGFDPDFRKLAETTWDKVPPNELTLWKWSGVYMQLQKGFFMIRLRLPGGVMNTKQLRKAAELARLYGQDMLMITTRQTLQYHWIRQQDIHKVMDAMRQLGIITKNACGDCTRNVVACPMVGVCPEEQADTMKMIMALADDPELRDEQRNLPRKHKISVAGCGRACGQNLMNDQGWHPVTHNGQKGWKFHAGGGLGSKVFMAQAIFDFVPEELVVDVSRASTEVFRRLGNRRNRGLARLKFVVNTLGAKAYGEEVLKVLAERNITGIDRIVPSTGPANIQKSLLTGQTVIAQKQKGLFSVRAIIKRSELNSREAEQFADWADTYGDGTLVFTNRQNLIIRGVPSDKTGELVEVIREKGYLTEGFEHIPDMVSCVGTTLCNLAVADTPNTYHRLMRELSADEAWWRKIGPVTINMNGCPNNCGQSPVADIGLRGLRKRTDHGSEEGYSIFVGGSLAGAGHAGEYICDVTAPYIVSAMRRLFEIYLERRSSEKEEFGDFARRLTGAGFKPLMGELAPSKDWVNERNQKFAPLFKEVHKNAKDITSH